MVNILKKTGLLKRFQRDESGQFAVLFSLFSGALLMAGAFAIEYSNIVRVQTELQAMSDAAALAGAHAAINDGVSREKIVLAALDTAGYYKLDRFNADRPDIDFDDETARVSVVLNGQLNMSLGGIFGVNQRSVGSKAVTGYPVFEVDPISIAFVLDASGSMGDRVKGVAKIDSLKRAAEAMFEDIAQDSVSYEQVKKHVRTGLVAYTERIEDSYDMNPGWKGTLMRVKNLKAEGSTNIALGMRSGLDLLLNDLGAADDARRFIVLMTDGENSPGAGNVPELDKQTMLTCKEAKAEDIDIYAISLDAGNKGKVVLFNCASPNGGISNPTAGGGGDDEIPDKIKKAIEICNKNGAPGQCKKVDDYYAANPPGYPDGTKTEYYFEAEDEASLKKAFKEIGQEIKGELVTRVIN